jgi:CRISPR-associated protein Csx10
MRIYYQLTTIDPVIVSQTTASTNNHECLDYIPGSAILGALASEHYASLSDKQSWNTFHSGEVKFGHCYPLVDNQIALPTPACWYFEKDSQAVVENKYKNGCIINQAAANFKREDSKQYKQCRGGYLNNQGEIANINKSNTTKTALDSKTGSAKESQLFSYSYLQTKQKFVGWLDCENEEILKKLKSTFNKVIRIGRSRNNEFGRAALEIINVSTPEITNQPNELVIWCLSDCEFINDFGMPTLTPQGKDIHQQLESAKLIPERSSIRTNRISLFNQKRQGFDSEQLVISKGSVLTFTLEKTLTNELLTKLSQGVGLNQQNGLGWVAINPQWANSVELNENELFSGYNVTTKITKTKASVVSSSPLTNWLAAQVQQQNTTKAIQEKVNQLAVSIIRLYQNSRRYNSIINSNEAGPSASQWGRIRMEVSKNNHQWQKNVFNGEKAICKANNDELGWGIKVQSEHGQTNFSDEIESLLSPQTIDTMRLLIEQLGRYDLSRYSELKKAQKAFPEGVEA